MFKQVQEAPGLPGLFVFVPGFLLDHGQLIHAVELGVAPVGFILPAQLKVELSPSVSSDGTKTHTCGIGKEAVVCRKLAPGGLLAGGSWRPACRLQGGKARHVEPLARVLQTALGQAHLVEDDFIAMTSSRKMTAIISLSPPPRFLRYLVRNGAFLAHLRIEAVRLPDQPRPVERYLQRR
jgi:hypothetical protein